MIEVVILICFVILSVLVSYREFGPQLKRQKFDRNYAVSLISICVIFPIYEESLFRSVIKQWLLYHPYANMINALLFGMYHSVNYLQHGKIGIVIYQVVSTIYLGHYVVRFDNILSAFMIHIVYNFSIQILSMLLVNFYKEPKKRVRFGKQFYVPGYTVDDMTKVECSDYIQVRVMDQGVLSSLAMFETLERTE
jgi:membrane protease YdiL (CAAX protease family)